jgi:nucleoid DNA-binding protein|tara:strand:- start:18664 stop:18879 length:216 start_codon:yes stop_codon:yes gene_type:complete
MNDQKELIQQLAEEYDLPTFVVESIVKSQFKFVQNKMEEGECAKVRLHHFGVFKVKPKRLYIMNKDTDNGE